MATSSVLIPRSDAKDFLASGDNSIRKSDTAAINLASFTLINLFNLFSSSSDIALPLFVLSLFGVGLTGS